MNLNELYFSQRWQHCITVTIRILFIFGCIITIRPKSNFPIFDTALTNSIHKWKIPVKYDTVTENWFWISKNCVNFLAKCRLNNLNQSRDTGFQRKFKIRYNTIWYSTQCFRKKTPTHIIGYKLRNTCLILIIFGIKIPYIIWHRMQLSCPPHLTNVSTLPCKTYCTSFVAVHHILFHRLTGCGLLASNFH